ncbi:MAG: DUF86 domain-containing protein [Candidatus Cloacimonetes bacterium]|nr:DUF86 domain-containing protein [Candidatus Cloacimonadota bacterium]
MKIVPMYNKSLVKIIFQQVDHSVNVIKRRFNEIHHYSDFYNSDKGIDLLDAICMQLIAIGESIKNVDKITNKSLLYNYPNIDWKGIMGIRDIISHHYFDIDAEEIFNVCKNELDKLQSTINVIIDDFKF